MNVFCTVEGQKLSIVTPLRHFAQGSDDFVKFLFTFSSDWDGLMTFAQFRQNNEIQNKYMTSETVDGVTYQTVTLPSGWEPGPLTMTLYGTGRETVVGTTNYVLMMIDETGFVADGVTSEIVETLYEQLVNRFIQYEWCYNIVKDYQGAWEALTAELDDATAWEEVPVTASGTAPASPSDGDYWWDSTNSLLKKYSSSDSDWVTISGKATGTSAPPAVFYYMDTTVGHEKLYQTPVYAIPPATASTIGGFVLDSNSFTMGTGDDAGKLQLKVASSSTMGGFKLDTGNFKIGTGDDAGKLLLKNDVHISGDFYANSNKKVALDQGALVKRSRPSRDLNDYMDTGVYLLEYQAPDPLPEGESDYAHLPVAGDYGYRVVLVFELVPGHTDPWRLQIYINKTKKRVWVRVGKLVSSSFRWEDDWEQIGTSVDTTLTNSGDAADAKAVGDLIYAGRSKTDNTPAVPALFTPGDGFKLNDMPANTYFRCSGSKLRKINGSYDGSYIKEDFTFISDIDAGGTYIVTCNYETKSGLLRNKIWDIYQFDGNLHLWGYNYNDGSTPLGSTIHWKNVSGLNEYRPSNSFSFINMPRYSWFWCTGAELLGYMDNHSFDYKIKKGYHYICTRNYTHDAGKLSVWEIRDVYDSLHLRGYNTLTNYNTIVWRDMKAAVVPDNNNAVEVYTDFSDNSSAWLAFDGNTTVKYGTLGRPHSNLLPIRGGQTYYMSYNIGGANCMGGFYDADKRWICGIKKSKLKNSARAGYIYNSTLYEDSHHTVEVGTYDAEDNPRGLHEGDICFDVTTGKRYVYNSTASPIFTEVTAGSYTYAHKGYLRNDTLYSNRDCTTAYPTADMQDNDIIFDVFRWERYTYNSAGSPKFTLIVEELYDDVVESIAVVPSYVEGANTYFPSNGADDDPDYSTFHDWPNGKPNALGTIVYTYITYFKFVAPENARYISINLSLDTDEFRRRTCLSSKPVFFPQGTGNFWISKFDPMYQFTKTRKLCIIGPSSVMIDKLYRPYADGTQMRNGPSGYISGSQEYVAPYYADVVTYGYSSAAYPDKDGVNEYSGKCPIYTRICGGSYNGVTIPAKSFANFDDVLIYSNGNGIADDNYEVGTSETYDDESTFTGAIHKIIEKIYTDNPHARIFLMTVNSQTSTGTEHEKRIAMNEQTFLLAEKFNCMVIDRSKAGLSNSQTYGAWTYDGTHLNNIGNRLFGLFIRKEIIGA